MVSAWRNRRGLWALGIAVCSLFAGTADAIEQTPGLPSWVQWMPSTISPASCKREENWIIFKPKGSKKVKKTPAVECVKPDGHGTTLKVTKCSASGLFTKTFEEECPVNTLCFQGACKNVKQDVPASVCTDSDHADLATLWLPPAGSNLPSPTLPPDDPQIFQPGKVTYAKGATKKGDYADACKGSLLVESVCMAAGVQQMQQVLVQCPQGMACNPEAEKNGIAGAACDNICPPPWSDICPEVPGCQLSFDECGKPTGCSPIDPSADYPDATVLGMLGNWHIDLCFPPGTDNVMHLTCEGGKPKVGTTTCPPKTTCEKGLCDGQEPEEQIPGCKDEDPPIFGNGWGNSQYPGWVYINGAGVLDSQDYCISKYIVNQSKCDAGNPKGYSFGPTTCPNPMECVDGVCLVTEPCDCEYEPGIPGQQPAKVSGTGKDGKPFADHDSCVGEQIAEVQCFATPSCYLKGPPLFCAPPPGEEGMGYTCVNDVCVPTFQPTCTDTDLNDAPDVKGTVSGVNLKKAAFSKDDYCTGPTTLNVPCDPIDGVKDNCPRGQLEQIQCALTKFEGWDQSSFSCPKGLCVDGACIKCYDSDKVNDPKAKGTVMTLTASHDDYCPVEGGKDLVQIDCATTNEIKFPDPKPCPGEEICQNGVCGAPINLCIGVSIDDNNKCTTDSCEPASGKLTHQPIACPAGQTCNPETGICGTCLTDAECNDNNLCNGKETCTGSKCTSGVAPAKSAGVLCDDNLKCTINDTCDNGLCTGTNILTTIDPSNKCLTHDCNPATGDVVTTAVTCPAGKLCKPETGACQECIADLQCDDKAICNGKEICVAGKCTAGAPPAKDDPTAVECFDKDKDGVVDAKDNCADKYNPEQIDDDNNGVGDTCQLSLAARHHHACATFLDGSTRCWGINADGELGIGPGVFSDTTINMDMKPVAMGLPNDPYGKTILGPLQDVTALATGHNHSCAVRKNGELYCWGSNKYGQLGIKNAPENLLLAAASDTSALGKSVLDVGAGEWHTCITLKDQTGSCVGPNDFGELGTGDVEPHSIYETFITKLIFLMPETGFVTIGGGAAFSCASRLDGYVKCWGLNGSFQLAYGGVAYSEAFPVYVHNATDSPGKLLTDAVDVSSGYMHSCALIKDGSVRCWGANTAGQLGFVAQKPSNNGAITVPGLSPTARIIGTGDYHTCVGLADGSVICWGDNTKDQLGSSTIGNPLTPTNVTIPQVHDVIDLAGGSDFTCARLQDFSVACWGGIFAPVTLIDPNGVVLSDPTKPPDCSTGTPTCVAPLIPVCDLYGAPTCKGSDLGKSAYALSCSPAQAAACKGSVCGNGIYEAAEQCEIVKKKYTSMAPSISCPMLQEGAKGYISCNTTTCQFDLTKCLLPGDPYANPPTPNQPLTLPTSGCGNWIVDENEICDHENLGGKTCKDFGYYDGDLICETDCQSFFKYCFGNPSDAYGIPDDPDYVPACDNGYLDPGEACDAGNHNGSESPENIPTCAKLGFYGGQTPTCSDNCKSVQSSLCYGITGNPFGGTQHCGDGVVNPGEGCDGKGSVKCTTLGYYGGTTYCGSSCQYLTNVYCYGWGNDPYGTPPK